MKRISSGDREFFVPELLTVVDAATVTLHVLSDGDEDINENDDDEREESGDGGVIGGVRGELDTSTRTAGVTFVDRRKIPDWRAAIKR